MWAAWGGGNANLDDTGEGKAVPPAGSLLADGEGEWGQRYRVCRKGRSVCLFYWRRELALSSAFEDEVCGEHWACYFVVVGAVTE